MKHKRGSLTQARLHELLDYNPETGIFTWKETRNWKATGGADAGSDHGGYIVIRVDGTLESAHRLVWVYMHGKYPEKFIDHVNGIRSDNRMANLREADMLLNNQNRRKPNKNNHTSQLLGVSIRKSDGKFRARICHNRKSIYLGNFDDAESAHAAYVEAKRTLHAGCSI